MVWRNRGLGWFDVGQNAAAFARRLFYEAPSREFVAAASILTFRDNSGGKPAPPGWTLARLPESRGPSLVERSQGGD
jgi:hypothetical protein